ncbi:non-specific lipid transfer protein GPI-anchored 14-like isoform X2 [Miscanthus floridulus]|uniref:non-specific lipid transfer protein GPI-anchored 14-like isoform X2 n=1 Tax=Miscanthus floridulus TaxID=154761 RepID=UPI00345B1D46
MDSRRRALLLAVAAVALVASWAPTGVVGDFAADRAECSDTLVGLATCLTYVQEQATATAPTPDCCAGLKTVLQSSRKCLCVLIKDRDNPNLGLKLNVTKALGLPAVCNAPANISDCPRLLNLPPDSKDAQVFEQFAKQAAAQGSAPTAGAQLLNCIRASSEQSAPVEQTSANAYMFPKKKRERRRK